MPKFKFTFKEAIKYLAKTVTEIEVHAPEQQEARDHLVKTCEGFTDSNVVDVVKVK